MSNLNSNSKSSTATVFPEHGPLNEDGKEILLSVKNVDITFGKKENAVKAVQNASFDIYKGETFSLVGESGSGKTTVGRAVIRVNPLAGGEILYKGVRISGKIPRALDRKVIRNIQMVFQDPAASLNDRATVDYIISEGLYNFHLYTSKADRQQKVEKMIKEVGLLPEHLTRYPHEFSGGQRQRIGIARAMVMEPELVVADEPISALDVSIRAQVLNLMKKFQREKEITYLFIAHDLSVVRFISDRIGVIYKGKIVEIAESEELFNYPLHPYTHSLISAIPIPDPKLEKNKVLYTYDPSIHDYSEEEPELVNIGHDHYVYGSKKEIEEYKAIRDKNEPVKSITINFSGTENAHNVQEMTASEDEIQLPPVHDTGSFLYKLLSFFLPIPGLIAAFIFRRINHIRNYRACKKGAIAGLITLGVIVVIFLLLILLAVI
ncbi:MAG: ATP-binding cassette domain-containing protein [Lachnospiraceae bacterium]|nr:ATP-binding cassette domain-containing protein [Lachnospiraceae bacterium]